MLNQAGKDGIHNKNFFDSEVPVDGNPSSQISVEPVKTEFQMMHLQTRASILDVKLAFNK